MTSTELDDRLAAYLAETTCRIAVCTDLDDALAIYRDLHDVIDRIHGVQRVAGERAERLSRAQDAPVPAAWRPFMVAGGKGR